MSYFDLIVAGIDVGGKSKGFHAVALQDGRFAAKTKSADPSEVVDWCLHYSACIVAVDAPCMWSREGSSRKAEREMRIGGRIIQCFRTPTRERACNRGGSAGFYGWMFNGEKLYRKLSLHYPLFDGTSIGSRVVLETFPHAIVCALQGRVVSARNKLVTRRELLNSFGIDDSRLPNIDFVDAALCALAAHAFLDGHWQCFGDGQEGFIVVPGPGFRKDLSHGRTSGEGRG